jgi:hypothetical protein
MTHLRRSSARLEVASLVSGIPSRHRDRRMFVVLQAFADESVGKYTVLAGYLSRQELWEKFADAWKAVLDKTPKLEYFKFNEAIHFCGQFSRVSENQRDRRLSELIAVIKDFVIAAMITAVHAKDYEDVVKGKFLTGKWKRLDNSYSHAFFNFIMDTITLIRRHRLQDKVDFIFDQNEVYKPRVMGAYDRMLLAAQDSELQILGSPPIFRDDKLFMPLQGGDMLSGYVNRRSLGKPYPSVLDQLREVPVVFNLWKKERMQLWLDGSKAILAKMRENNERSRKRFLEIRDLVPIEYKKEMAMGTSYPEFGQLAL